MGFRSVERRFLNEQSGDQEAMSPMKQSLAQFIERLDIVSGLANRERKEIEALYSRGPITSLEEAGEMFLNEPTPAQRALEAFLRWLAPPILFSILVLMYAGRDGEEALECVDDHCRPSVSLEGAVTSIAEKHPRMEYIREGVSRLGVQILPELLDRVRAKLGELGQDQLHIPGSQ